MGHVELALDEGRSLYLFTGSNGVGKTKVLEALYQSALFSSSAVESVRIGFDPKLVVFGEMRAPGRTVSFAGSVAGSVAGSFVGIAGLPARLGAHDRAVVFVGSQGRGFVSPDKPGAASLGSAEDRRWSYVQRQLTEMPSNFTALNMDVDVGRWFVVRAQSDNPYQSVTDNRAGDLRAMLRVLHLLEPRIDPEFLEISGSEAVSLRIDGEPRPLSELSTGFSAVLKIVQAIVSGFASLTNAARVEDVDGMVFIDEVESHLHVGWQAKVMRLLRQAFPRATFYVTTHSPLVSAQCADGEVYTLFRDDESTVRTRRIEHPGQAAFVDLLDDVFGVDTNRLKLDRMEGESQADGKRALLDLVRETGTQR